MWTSHTASESIWSVPIVSVCQKSPQAYTDNCVPIHIKTRVTISGNPVSLCLQGVQILPKKLCLQPNKMQALICFIPEVQTHNRYILFSSHVT